MNFSQARLSGYFFLPDGSVHCFYLVMGRFIKDDNSYIGKSQTFTLHLQRICHKKTLVMFAKEPLIEQKANFTPKSKKKRAGDFVKVDTALTKRGDKLTIMAML